jgi:hypothetical protein
VRQAFSILRFPSICRTVPSFLYQGVIFGSVSAIRGTSSWGYALLLLSFLFVAVDCIVEARCVNPQAVPIWLDNRVSSRCPQQLFVGVMLWSPEDVRNRFGSLVDPYLPSQRWFFLMDVGLQFSAAAVSALPPVDAVCTALIGTLTAVFLIAAAVTVFFHPYRRFGDNVLQCIVLVLMAILTGVRTSPMLGRAATGITISVTLVLMIRAGFRLLSLLVERNLHAKSAAVLQTSPSVGLPRRRIRKHRGSPENFHLLESFLGGEASTLPGAQRRNGEPRSRPSDVAMADLVRYICRHQGSSEPPPVLVEGSGGS